VDDPYRPNGGYSGKPHIAAMLKVGLILWGWALSQSPFLLQGEMTISEAAAAPPALSKEQNECD
jgi:hypothetical protein